MRPAFLEAHLKREPATVQKYQLLWQFYVKNGQPLRAAEVLGALAESDQYVAFLGPVIYCQFTEIGAGLTLTLMFD
jgi:nuclear pore complex protein Nup155